MQVSSYNNTIVIVSTLIFFAFSLLLTANTGKEVQDGYWKIAVLRKLTVIQKDLEFNNELLSHGKKVTRAENFEEDEQPSKKKKASKFNNTKNEDNKKSEKIDEENIDNKKPEELVK